ncbi:MAG: response regulator, partial [Bdellovibrionales bacterium]|nr:response regulator [Bdellovibrionales bacterium]
MIASPPKIPILLVDDIAGNRIALMAVLDSTEYELIEAHSGPEAIDYLKTNECAVILMDVQMPLMDGYETAAFIRKIPHAVDIPIIFVTASIENTEKIFKGYQAGAVDYIFKPYEPDILRSKVAVFVQLFKARKEIARQSELIRIQEFKERDSFLEDALDAVVGMNQEGLVCYWNKQATKIFGWSREEAFNKRMSDLIIPENYRDAHETGLALFLQTGVGPILRQRIEVSALKKNGTEFEIELSVTPIRADKKFIFYAFVRD